MNKNLGQLNRWAKQACPMWEKSRAQRESFARKCQAFARSYYSSKEHQDLVREYKAGNHDIDTYPWPYCDRDFADFMDLGEPDTYVLDESGFVIRSQASYAAWRIYEVTGKWPEKQEEITPPSQWVQFLAKIGYNIIVEKPTSDAWYVGASAFFDKGRGFIVWAESGTTEGVVEVSSYVNGEYWHGKTLYSNFTWVKIE